MSKPKQDPVITEAIKDTAMFVAGIITKTPARVQIGAYAVLLSSAISTAIKEEDRDDLFDSLVKEMRHAMKQAAIAQRKKKKAIGQ